jgi:hypothetical protein
MFPCPEDDDDQEIDGLQEIEIGGVEKGVRWA